MSDYSDIFNRESPEREPRRTLTAPFTPCSGLSRMSLNSTRVLPTTSFTDKLSQVMEEDSVHPNLNMFLNDTKITILDSKKKDSRLTFISDDEEEDVFEFSSNVFFSPRSIFDNDTTISDFEQGDPFFDPSNAWVFSIYEDTQETDVTEAMMEDIDEGDDENRPPRVWLREMEQQQKKHSRRISHESNSSGRSPLQEIELMVDEADKNDIHTRKKVAVGNTPKMRIIRTLSPTRDSKRKGKDVDMSLS